MHEAEKAGNDARRKAGTRHFAIAEIKGWLPNDETLIHQTGRERQWSDAMPDASDTLCCRPPPGLQSGACRVEEPPSILRSRAAVGKVASCQSG